MKNTETTDRVAPRPEVLDAPAVPHGAPDYAELETLGLQPEEVIDFSVNGNPYGPPPGVREALESVPLARYPDRESLAFRRAVSSRLDVPPERILVGNGTAELIWLIALTFVRSGDHALVLEPTFGEYARAVSLMGGQVTTWRARPNDGFSVQPEEIRHQLDHLRPRLVFLCNPNNPTGAAVPSSTIAAWAEAFPDTLFVVDEAYHTFADRGDAEKARELSSAAGLAAPNVVTLRSMTKDYALAGLRLGYLVAREEVADAIARVRPPWNVNAMAQAAGVAALRHANYVSQCVARLHEHKISLVTEVAAMGLEPAPSRTHFFLIRVGDAAAYRRALLARRIQVRDCASFGLPAYVRVATLRPPENAQLIEALRDIVT